MISLSRDNSFIRYPSLSYTLDGEGRPITATDTSNSLNLMTGITYNAASQATAVTFGNGDSDTFTPDANTGRITGYQNVVTGSSPFTDKGILTWNANGSLGTFQWTDGNNTANNQTCTYAADALNRTTSANYGGAWAQTFSYDAFGNVFRAGSSSYSPSSYNAQTNQAGSGAGSGSEPDVQAETDRYIVGLSV